MTKFEAAKTAEGVYFVCIKTDTKQTTSQIAAMLESMGIPLDWTSSEEPIVALTSKEYANSEHCATIHRVEGRTEFVTWMVDKRSAEEPAKRQKVSDGSEVKVDSAQSSAGVNIKLSNGILSWDAPLPALVTLPREHYQKLSEELIAIKINSVKLRGSLAQKEAVLEAKERHLEEMKEQLDRSKQAAQQREAKFAEHLKSLEVRCNNALKAANARHADATKAAEERHATATSDLNAALEIKSQQCDQLMAQNQQLIRLISKK